MPSLLFRGECWVAKKFLAHATHVLSVRLYELSRAPETLLPPKCSDIDVRHPPSVYTHCDEVITHSLNTFASQNCFPVAQWQVETQQRHHHHHHGRSAAHAPFQAPVYGVTKPQTVVNTRSSSHPSNERQLLCGFATEALRMSQKVTNTLAKVLPDASNTQTNNGCTATTDQCAWRQQQEHTRCIGDANSGSIQPEDCACSVSRASLANSFVHLYSERIGNIQLLIYAFKSTLSTLQQLRSLPRQQRIVLFAGLETIVEAVVKLSVLFEQDQTQLHEDLMGLNRALADDEVQATRISSATPTTDLAKLHDHMHVVRTHRTRIQNLLAAERKFNGFITLGSKAVRLTQALSNATAIDVSVKERRRILHQLDVLAQEHITHKKWLL
jgi:hypothetical protein